MSKSGWRTSHHCSLEKTKRNDVPWVAIYSIDETRDEEVYKAHVGVEGEKGYAYRELRVPRHLDSSGKKRGIHWYNVGNSHYGSTLACE